MADQVPRDVADRRAREIMRRQHLRTAAANSKLTGQIMEIMVDDIEENYAVGRTDADAPDIDQNVYVELPAKVRFAPGDRIKVRITGALKGGDLEAETVR
jgi:ribosomal protein S12 methylthiotransferase